MFILINLDNYDMFLVSFTFPFFEEVKWIIDHCASQTGKNKKQS
jgi:hypothetical protein